ncbi:hypothetical protein [Novosphingobium mangrovi (ex Huang et al. 2023)]|uniref:Uncharacterized protein n=1 Tax=Novosphingobium mangrovi (ex Huang et al. 2023) TaxID=2976432 RepID=A0ABT2I794_9SPHN|nr:hypothetical protein [Novosphingobium mangrovi (ex Huang et al. 2023)]MCT2400695.1 hypothetical protein [Novosphingobium mangrovi (ex Huang et al. 2023)]
MMTKRAAIRKFGIAALLVCGVLLPGTVMAGPETAAIAGQYNGTQMEMAVHLELGEDGRYRYALSYGAVDEYSQGTWTSTGSAIVLTSDPVDAPRFDFLGEKAAAGGPKGALAVDLEVPKGLPLSLFRAVVTLADGRSFTSDFSDDGLIVPLEKGGGKVSIRLGLPIFEVQGEPVLVDNARGKRLSFAFVPNALGFKIFDHAVLPLRDGAYVFQRYGRDVMFRKVED